MVTSVVAAVGGLLCAPIYDKIKASVDVLNAPESFAADAEKLSNMMNDIKAMRSSDEIDRWLLESEKIMEKVPQVLLNCDISSSQNDGLQLSCCIFGHEVSRCKLHKKMRKLTTQGQNIKTSVNLNVEIVEHILGVPNIEDGTTAERNLGKIMDMLNDDAVWSIGVCGPGGVGKTTLANALNNKLENNSLFTMAILVPLTKDVDENQVQKAIAKKLKLKVEEGVDTREIANQIYNRLQREKFLLILDNVWTSVDLRKIGIPKSQNASKVMLTTRLKNVCIEMEAEEIEIGYLTAMESWQLFVEKAGDVATDPTIRSLAEDVCRECGGLPLAIVAVGSAMKGKTSIHSWKSAIDDLKSSIFPDGIESQVYKPLKLSFDFLANETLRSCFIYCSLYPEGYNIQVSELVKSWLAENIIDEQLNYESAYSKGVDLIEKLKNSSLLEHDSFSLAADDIFDTLKMHDVVRDVAIRIAESNGTSIVFSGHGIHKSARVAFQKGVENIRWMSFVDNEKIILPEDKKDFPKVTTLLICKTKEWVQVSKEFLQGFPELKVLNVYSLEFLSCSHCHLTELRALGLRYSSIDLEELQCGEKLMALDFDYSSYKLPRRIKKQTNLRVLNLQGTKIRESIEVDVILNLSALERLDMTDCGYKWHTTRRRRSKSKKVVLQDLSQLQSLKEVNIELADVEATYAECGWMERLKSCIFVYSDTDSYGYSYTQGQKNIYISAYEIKIGSFILRADYLTLECIHGRANAKKVFANFNSNDLSTSKLKSLRIENYSFSIESTGSVPNSNALPNLEFLDLDGIEGVRSFSQRAYALGTTFPKLRAVCISAKQKKKKKKKVWLKKRAGDFVRTIEFENIFSSDYPHVVLPELEVICVNNCKRMTEVFHDGPANTQAFAPKLKCLDLSNMESLQSLCSYESSEQCDSLKVLRVRKCPSLKKLPNMPSIQEIWGEEEWWNNLEWISSETKSYMNRFFKRYEWDSWTAI